MHDLRGPFAKERADGVLKAGEMAQRLGIFLKNWQKNQTIILPFYWKKVQESVSDFNSSV